jgi:hypothetical protein
MIVWDFTTSIGTAMTMTGSHWLAITLLSCLGFFYNPITLCVVFMHQLIYKSVFLIVHVIPNLVNRKYELVPIGMSCFFLAWVILLPFAIPWKYFFKTLGRHKVGNFISGKYFY